MKTCIRCGVSKDYSCFHNQALRKDGLYPHCKECRTIERKLIRLKNGQGIRTDFRTTEQKFIDSIYPEPNTGCWLWGGRVSRNGYPTFSDRGFISGHRYSYKYFKGDFDNNLHVLHKCDVCCCVNPDHLFLGTHQDNMKDKAVKGRTNPVRGILHYSAKLTNDQVLQIRKLHNPSVFSTRKLARMFNVNQRLIFNIIHRTVWKHI